MAKMIIRGDLPFPVDVDEPDRAFRDRYLQIRLVGAVGQPVLEAIYASLDLWATLPVLGGYPGDGRAPRQSIAVAEPAFLVDPTTIEMAFPEVFVCDDDCFAAVVHYAHALHHSGCEVQGVLLG